MNAWRRHLRKILTSSFRSTWVAVLPGIFVPLAFVLAGVVQAGSDAAPVGTDVTEDPCPQPSVATLTVAFDEAWAERFVDSGAASAEAVAEAASRRFEPFCLDFQTVETVPWTPSSAAISLHDLIAVGGRDLEERSGEFLLILTDRYVEETKDGLADDGVAVMKHHQERMDRDITVAAHELGHLIGLHDHRERCECLMDPKAYHNGWGEYHRRVLAAAARDERGALAALQDRHRTLEGPPPCEGS